jgi:hypothetical protein
MTVSHSINEILDIGYNLGYNYSGIGKGDLIYSVSFGAEISKKIRYYAETYGEITDIKDLISNFDSGFTYLIKDNLQVAPE